MNVAAEITSIRRIILDVLEEADAVDDISDSRLSAFGASDEDILLNELELDSMLRMDLLVALELEYGVVISPQEFLQFSSLGGIAAHTQQAAAANPSPETQLPDNEPVEETDATSTPDSSQPHAIKLFQRAFRGCRTVAELNKVLTSLEHRLTPLEVRQLSNCQRRHELLPAHTADKYHTALAQWFEQIERLMYASGKVDIEPYVSRRIGPAVWHFTSAGTDEPNGGAGSKTLLVCFTMMDSRRLMIPHPVMLQHCDANRYDLLVIADPWNTAFRAGVPFLGSNVSQVVESIAGLPLLKHYKKIRTYGTSAGAYPAILMGYRLRAELTVGLAGRLPSERHLATIIGMLSRIGAASFGQQRVRLLMAYPEDKSRDTAFARRVSLITGSSRLAIRLPNSKTRHLVLTQLLELRELARLFQQTIFASTDDALFTEKRAFVTRTFPVNAGSG